MEAQCVHMDPGVTSGHRQALQEDAGLHIPSVSATIPPPCSAAGTACFLMPLLLVLFSFSPGSEVLFGLVFRVLVYKHDFCLMGTLGLADTFLPSSSFLCLGLIHSE